jgi:histone H1/5
MIENNEDIDKFDKRYVRKYLDSDIGELKKKIEEKTIELDGETNEIDSHSFDNLYDKCDGLIEKQKPKCEKVVRSHIKKLVNEAKQEVATIKEYIKELREQMKNKNLLKKTSMEEIDENTENYAQEYEKFKNSLYYNIKYSCGKTIKSNSKLREEIKEHPNVIKYDKKLLQLNNNITELQSSLKNTMENYKNRVKQIRLLLKMDLNPLEKSVVRMTIKDEQKTVRNLIKIKEKENNEAIDQIKISIKKTEKRREKRYKNVRKTIRKMIDNDKREQRETRKTEMKLRKSLRKAGEYNEEFKDETIRNLVNKYSEVIDEDLKQLDKDEVEKEELKERKKQEKQEKQAAMEVKKAEKEAEKIERKTLKLREREEKRATKKAQQDLKKQEKAAAKLMKKTRKR